VIWDDKSGKLWKLLRSVLSGRTDIHMEELITTTLNKTRITRPLIRFEPGISIIPADMLPLFQSATSFLLLFSVAKVQL
jgi:hypothetical protein